MPDLNQYLQAIGMQDIQGNPAQGQAQYNSGWQGLAAGISDAIAKSNNQQRSRVESTRQQLLSMIDQIPDNEQNAPLKFKLRLDIMNAKDKHWSDKVLAPHTADSLIANMYKMFQDKLPQEQPKPSMVQPDELGRQGGMSFAVSPQGPGGGQGVNIPAPVDNSGKFQFENPGKWQEINQVFHDDDTGETYLMSYDKNTGKTRKISLGQATTDRIKAAELRAQAKKTAVSKGYYTMALAESRLTPEQFDQLPIEMQQEYYAKAADTQKKLQDLKSRKTESDITKNEAIIPEAKATTRLKTLQADQIAAQPKNPEAITPDDARTIAESTKAIDEEIRAIRKTALGLNDNATAKQVKDAKARLEELQRRRAAIVNQYKSKRPQGSVPSSAIPRGSSGPATGTNPNDPLGINDRLGRPRQ